jgi:hypothetical protein
MFWAVLPLASPCIRTLGLKACITTTMIGYRKIFHVKPLNLTRSAMNNYAVYVSIFNELRKTFNVPSKPEQFET